MSKRNFYRAVSVNLMIVSSMLVQPAIAQEPNFDRGKQLYAQGMYKEAFPFLNQAAKANPHNPTVFYYEALTLQRLGHLPEAMDVYGKIRRFFPNSPEARMATTALSSAAKTALAAPAAKSAPASPAATNYSAFGANAGSSELAGLPDETKVPFSRATGGHLYVDAFVNNHPMRVLFDTGASTCLFGKNQFDAAGVTPQLTNQKQALGGVGSKITTTTVGIVDLRVGEISRHMQVMVADDLQTPPLLGETFFNGYRYDIDNSGGFIHFMKKSSSGGRSNYDPVDTVNVPFEGVGNNMVVHVKVNGVDCPMYFDTGAAGNVFAASSAAAIGLQIPSDAQPVRTGGIGGSAMGFEFNVARMELGPVVKTNMPVTVMMSGGPPLPLLGQPFFRDRRFTIDNESHVIKFVH